MESSKMNIDINPDMVDQAEKKLDSIIDSVFNV
jgi:hypothetical protein